MEDLRTAISSEKDSSLITQVQKLRSTVSDGQNDLIKEFREFATNIAILKMAKPFTAQYSG